MSCRFFDLLLSHLLNSNESCFGLTGLVGQHRFCGTIQKAGHIHVFTVRTPWKRNTFSAYQALPRRLINAGGGVLYTNTKLVWTENRKSLTLFTACQLSHNPFAAYAAASPSPLAPDSSYIPLYSCGCDDGGHCITAPPEIVFTFRVHEKRGNLFRRMGRRFKFGVKKSCTKSGRKMHDSREYRDWLSNVIILAHHILNCYLLYP